jgi:hydrogenase 3 maturation protease
MTQKQKKATLPKNFSKRVKGARRVVIVGVGNPMKADDGLGAMCAELLFHELLKNPHDNIKVIVGGEVPENYTGKIRALKPTHVIIIDAALAKQKPGTILLMDDKRIKNESVSTHQVPLSLLVQYLRESVGAEVVLIGVEPKSLEWGKPISPPVKKAITALAKALVDTLPRVMQQ